MRPQDDYNTLLEQSRTTHQRWLFKPLRAQPSVRGFVFDGRESVLGSAAECGLRVNVAGVADEHCVLSDDDGRLLVNALDNRTWVNDGPIRKAHLRDGDRLTVGPITLQVEAIAAEPEDNNTADADLPLRQSQLVQFLERAYDQGRVDGQIPGEMRPRSARSTAKTEAVVDELHNALKATQDQLQRQQQKIAQLEEKPPAPAVSELKREIQAAEAEKQNAAVEAERKRLQAERDALAAQFEKWLRIKSKWNSRYSGQRTELRSEFSRLQARQEELQSKADELLQREQELLDGQQTREQTERRIRELSLQAEQLETQLVTARTLEEGTETRLRELEDKLREYADSETLTAELQAQCDTLTNRGQELEQQLEAAVQQREDLQAELSARDSQIESQAERLAELDQTAASLRGELEECQQQLSQNESELSERNGQLDALQSLLDKAEVDNEQLAERCQELEQQTTVEHAQRQAELDAEWTRLSEERDRLLELREQLAEQRAAFTQAHEDLRSVRDELEQEKGRFREEQEEWTGETLRQQILDSREETSSPDAPGISDELHAADEEAAADDTPVDEIAVPPVGQDFGPDSLRENASTDSELEAISEAEADLEPVSETEVTEEVTETESDVEAEAHDADVSDESTAAGEFAELPSDDADLTTAAEHSSFVDEDPDAAEFAGGADWNELSFEDPAAPGDELDDTPQAAMTEEPIDVAAEAVEIEAESTADNEVTAEEKPVAEAAEEEFQFSELAEILANSEQQATEATASDLDAEREIEPNTDDAFATEAVADEPVAAEDSSGEETDGDEFSSLRKELAEMFGISSDSSAEELEAEPQAEQADDGQPTGPEEMPPSTGFEQSELLQSTHERDLAAEEEPPPFEAASFVDEAFQTDAFAADGQEQPEPSEPVASDPPADGEVVVDDIEDADSVAAYMQRLFARTGQGQDYSEPQAPAAPSKPAESDKSPSPSAVESTLATDPPVVDGNEASMPPEPKRPMAQIDREQLKQEIASLRDVANQTARQALATHAWKQVKLKMMASGALTGVSAVASAVLISSPMWSPVSYRNYGWMTLVLTFIATFELFRSRLGLIRLKQQPAREPAAVEPAPTHETQE